MQDREKPPRIGIYAIGSADVPSTRFRMIQYLPYLKKSGFDVRMYVLPSVNGGRLIKFLGLLLQALLRWFQLGNIRKFDLVVIQKGLSEWRCRALFGRLVSFKKPYLYDVDDAVYATAPVQLPVGLRWLQDFDEPLRLMRGSRHIIAGNNYLAAFIRNYNKRVSVIPTSVDTDMYKCEIAVTKNQPLVLGWSGSPGTNVYFNALIPALNQLAKRNRFLILLMSGSANHLDIDRLPEDFVEFVQWDKTNEISVLKRMNIGLAPLNDDEWTRGKCGLKALLYMALGIPVVGSPVGVNAEIIQDGINGFLAETEEEWIRKLEILMKDDVMRARMGIAARGTVEKKYSIKENVLELERIMRTALQDG